MTVKSDLTEKTETPAKKGSKGVAHSIESLNAKTDINVANPPQQLNLSDTLQIADSADLELLKGEFDNDNYLIDAPITEHTFSGKLKKETKVAYETYTSMDLNAIEFNVKNNPRKKYKNIEKLAHSLIKHGQQEPITVVMNDDGKTARLIHGFRRRIAMEYANNNLGGTFNRAKVIVVDKKIATFEYEMSKHFISNNESEKLEPLEEAEVFFMLKTKSGWSNEEISDNFNRTVSHVSALLQLYHVSDEVKAMIEAGQVSATTVSKLTKNISKQNSGKGTKKGTVKGSCKSSTTLKGNKKGEQKPKIDVNKEVETQLNQALLNAQNAGRKNIIENDVQALQNANTAKTLSKLEALTELINSEVYNTPENKDKIELLESVLMFMQDVSLTPEIFAEVYFSNDEVLDGTDVK